MQCAINCKSAKYICKTPVGPEVEGNINGDLPIQCNDIGTTQIEMKMLWLLSRGTMEGRTEEISTETHGLTGSRIYSLTGPGYTTKIGDAPLKLGVYP